MTGRAAPGRATSLVFQAPFVLALEETAIPRPAADEVLVQTLVSAISPGTELLLYRGQMPPELALDATISELAQPVNYPQKYGYALVGQVVATGQAVAADWLGRHVFAFRPHQTHLVARPETLIPLPDGMAPETAVFLPTMETAVSLLMDGQPAIGERVVVVGQGVVGLVTLHLLSRLPLAALIGLDPIPERREWSRHLGATASFDPADPALADHVHSEFGDEEPAADADLVFELSGDPAGLDMAIRLTGFGGRVVVGSWYGQKRFPLDLGGWFHRSHMRLISSQVSRLSPTWSARWTKARRLTVAWQQLRAWSPADLVTHRFPLAAAVEAFALLDSRPDETLQILFTYDRQPIIAS